MTPQRVKNYILKAQRIHNDAYTYDENKVTTFTCKDKIKVTCPKHGDFATTWDNHVNGKQGCPKCHHCHKPTNEEFKARITKIYGEKYDLSKVEYKGMNKKVTLICHEVDEFGQEHGEFEVYAKHLMSKSTGCKKCSHNYHLTFDEFVEKANKIHNNKYEYVRESYIDTVHDITIICNELDEDGNMHGAWSQNAGSHLSGCGCPKCNGGTLGSLEDFVKKAKAIHNGYYSYDNFNYVNARTAGLITCPVHGDFPQVPYSHLAGRGCPKCKTYVLENLLLKEFDEIGIDYVFQYGIKGVKSQKCDFYIPSANLVIECQGEQHFTPTTFSKHKTKEETYEKTILYDRLKYQYCQENGIDVVYFTIPYLFVNKKTDINTPFYADKKLFTSKETLIEYIQSKIHTEIDDTFQMFVNDLKTLVSQNVLVKDNNIIQIMDLHVKFVKLVANERNELNDVRRYYTKRGKKIIIVFEDEYVNCKDIVISKIKHQLKFNKLPRIGARKCDIRPISKNEAESFLVKNHIQGFVNSSVYIGGFFEDRLVGVMSFLEEKTLIWNLTRFATDNNVICQGLGGKIFKYFLRNYSVIYVKTFADKRWTINLETNLYEQLGFKQELNMFPEYRYINVKKDGIVRHHKFGFRKQILHKKYGLPLDMTETEMTKKLGYDRIWDCGLLKYVYTNPNIQ